MAEETLLIKKPSDLTQTKVKADMTQGRVRRLITFLLFLICGSAVFLFGSNYFSLFPTNESNLFRAALAGSFLGAALVLRRFERIQDYAAPAYAFFIASMGFLLTSLLLPLQEWMLEVFRTSPSNMVGATVSKYYQVLVIVPLIIILTRLAGGDLRSIYLRRGLFKLGLIAGGIVLFVLVATGLIISALRGSDLNIVGDTLLWVSIFSFGNSLMEELWFRGIFMRGYQKLIGPALAVILTAVLFALAHVGVVYMDPAAIPVFLGFTFTLGVGTAYLMYRTGSLLGPVLIHMGADIIGILVLGS